MGVAWVCVCWEWVGEAAGFHVVLKVVTCGGRSLMAALALLLPPGQGDPDGSGLAVLCHHSDRKSLGRAAEAPGHRAGAGEQSSCHVLR